MTSSACATCETIQSGESRIIAGYTNESFISDYDYDAESLKEFQEFNEHTQGLDVPGRKLKKFYGGYSTRTPHNLVLVCPVCGAYYLFFHSSPGWVEYNPGENVMRDNLIPLTASEARIELEKTLIRARETKKLYHSKHTFQEIYGVSVQEIEAEINKHLKILEQKE